MLLSHIYRPHVLFIALACCRDLILAQRVVCRVGLTKDAMRECAVNDDTHPVHLDGPFLSGNLVIRSKFWYDSDEKGRSLTRIPYFSVHSERKRQLSFQFQLRFKEELSAKDLLWGMELDQSVQLPSSFLVNSLVAAAKMIDPMLQADISERGVRWFSPIIPFMNIVNVCESPLLSPMEWKWGADLPELEENNALLFTDGKSRSVGERKRLCKRDGDPRCDNISTTAIYNFEVGKVRE
jgi:hypothetical protein